MLNWLKDCPKQSSICWSPEKTWSDLLEIETTTSSLHYISEINDEKRYQPYSRQEGALQPTAGLHTNNANELQETPTDYPTLHVSAGTFQPIKQMQTIKCTANKYELPENSSI